MKFIKNNFKKNTIFNFFMKFFTQKNKKYKKHGKNTCKKFKINKFFTQKNEKYKKYGKNICKKRKLKYATNYKKYNF